MVVVNVRDRDGADARIDAPSYARMSLMEIIRNNSSMSIEAICGGMMSCSTCHVYVDPKWEDRIGRASDEEHSLLFESAHFRQNSRLSCQISINDECDGLSVEIAPAD